MMSFHDLFSGHAGDYREFRPTYPAELFAYLATLPTERERAWDCGTGNGQAAVALKAYFNEVIATDPSREQIDQAPTLVGVRYQVAPAEAVGLPDDSIDLVTVAQALHWFDLDRFYAEVRRVGKPGAAIACWCYGLMTIGLRIDPLIRELYGDILATYWSPRRRLVDDGYRSLDFPFREVQPPAFAMQCAWTLPETIGYLSTWSAVHAYARTQNANAIDVIADRLSQAWGDADTRRTISWPLQLRVGYLNSTH